MISPLFLLIPLLLAAAWLLYRFPFWEASRDYEAILADGSADTLKEAFHFWRGARRGAVIAGIAAAAAAPLLWLSFWSWLLLALAVGLAGNGWFFVLFNLKLSVLRGLDPYYVSFDARAARFPDRYLAGKARARVAQAGGDARAVAADLFKQLLRRCFAACLLLSSTAAAGAGALLLLK